MTSATFPFVNMDMTKFMTDLNPAKIVDQFTKAASTFQVPQIDADCVIAFQRKNIEAAAKRLADKKKGRGNTKTLSYIKGALGGAGEVDLGRAYYDAIVKHAREPDASEAMDAEDAQPAPVANVATLEEEAACQLSLATKQQTHTAKLLLGRRGNGKKIRGKNGSGVFSKRARRRDPSRPPKEMVSF